MDDDLYGLLIVCVLLAVGGILGFLIGLGVQEGSWQEKAIENNAAIWVIDAKTGEKELEWCGCCDSRDVCPNR